MVPNYEPPILDEDDLSQTFLFRDLSNLDPANAASTDINLNNNQLVNVTNITPGVSSELRLVSSFIGFGNGDILNLNNLPGNSPQDIGGDGSILFANSEVINSVYFALMSSDVGDGSPDIQSGNMNFRSGAVNKSDGTQTTGSVNIASGSIQNATNPSDTGGLFFITGDNYGTGNSGNINLWTGGAFNGGDRGDLVIDTKNCQLTGPNLSWFLSQVVFQASGSFEITSDFYRYYGTSGEFINMTSPVAGSMDITFSDSATIAANNLQLNLGTWQYVGPNADSLTIQNVGAGTIEINASFGMSFNQGNGAQFAFNLNAGYWTIYGSNGDVLTIDNDTATEIGMSVSGATLRIDDVVRFARLAGDPAGAVGGDAYYNTTTGKLRVYNDVLAAWEDCN